MDRQLIEQTVERHEGRRLTVYKDTLGNLTTGVGCLLMVNTPEGLIPVPAAQELFESLGIDFKAVCNGEIALTDQQCDEIFDHQISGAIFAARCQLKNFNTLPDVAQAVVVDMEFNLGSTRFAEFKELIAAVEAGDFPGAAAQIKNSLWCRQVGNRCADDARLMASAA